MNQLQFIDNFLQLQLQRKEQDYLEIKKLHEQLIAQNLNILLLQSQQQQNTTIGDSTLGQIGGINPIEILQKQQQQTQLLQNLRQNLPQNKASTLQKLEELEKTKKSVKQEETISTPIDSVFSKLKKISHLQEKITVDLQTISKQASCQEEQEQQKQINKIENMLKLQQIKLQQQLLTTKNISTQKQETFFKPTQQQQLQSQMYDTHHNESSLLTTNTPQTSQSIEKDNIRGDQHLFTTTLLHTQLQQNSFKNSEKHNKNSEEENNNNNSDITKKIKKNKDKQYIESAETKNLPANIGNILLRKIKERLPDNELLKNFDDKIKSIEDLRRLFTLSDEIKLLCLKFLQGGPLLSYVSNSMRIKQKRLVIKYFDILIKGCINTQKFSCFKKGFVKN